MALATNNPILKKLNKKVAIPVQNLNLVVYTSYEIFYIWSLPKILLKNSCCEGKGEIYGLKNY